MKKLALGLGVAALALSTTAMAANTGWYAGVQAGYNKYTNTNGKKLNGVYSIDSVDVTVTNTKAKNTSGFAGALDAGYNFNKYFGLQFDLTKYQNLKFKGDAAATGATSGSETATLKFWSADLMAMGYYPIQNFDLFGGLGYAYINEKVSANTTLSNGVVTGSVKASDTYHHWRPKATFGVDYRFMQNWSANLSYSRILGKGNTGSGKKYVPDFNTVMFGVNYSF